MGATQNEGSSACSITAGTACIGSVATGKDAWGELEVVVAGTGHVDLGKPGWSTPSGETLAMPFSQIDAQM